MKLSKSKLKQIIEEEMTRAILEEDLDGSAKRMGSSMYVLETELQALNIDELSDNVRENLLKQAGRLASTIKHMRSYNVPYAGSEYKPKANINYENN